MTVACVLRSGGDYTADWVVRLQRQAQRHLGPHRFVCLSDVPVPCERIPLDYDWPGWWSKMELFRPGVFDGPVLYLDLDTLVVGDIADVASYRGPLASLSDFYDPRLAQSGVMAWTPGVATHAIWDAWVSDVGDAVRRYSGDGDFLHANALPDRLQELYPGRIGSYKAHQLTEGPEDYSIVCFHGRPRPSDVTTGWVSEVWR